MTEVAERPAGPTALIVEDDPKVRAVVAAALGRALIESLEASGLAEARQSLTGGDVDLVVLDLGLPDGHGLELLEEVRATTGIPVVVLSGRGDVPDRLLGFRSGADDYLVKPFPMQELVARVQAVLRRARLRSGERRRVGQIVVDPAAREVWGDDGRLLHLPARELDLLLHLMSRPGEAVSREDLLASVWGSSISWQSPRTVTEHVRRLRQKIEVDPTRPRHLVTVRSFGYRFDD